MKEKSKYQDLMKKPRPLNELSDLMEKIIDEAYDKGYGDGYDEGLSDGLEK